MSILTGLVIGLVVLVGMTYVPFFSMGDSDLLGPSGVVVVGWFASLHRVSGHWFCKYQVELPSVTWLGVSVMMQVM